MIGSSFILGCVIELSRALRSPSLCKEYTEHGELFPLKKGNIRRLIG
jgi:hypothetical protein